MDESKLKAKLIRNAQQTYSRPKISAQWLVQTLNRIIDEATFPFFDYEYCSHALNEAILNASFEDIAVHGTSGLATLMNSPSEHVYFRNGVILELTHLTEVGASVFEVEEVRMARRDLQWQARKSVVRSLMGTETARLVQPESLPQYPRGCLKLYLSDGFQELEALESPGHSLPNVTLGETPMGTKILLRNVRFLAGTAQLSPENVVVLGGAVPSKELDHSVRLFRDIEARLEEELWIVKS